MQEAVSYLKELASETDKVKQSEFFKHYLDTMSRFWNYSFRNQLLIFRQVTEHKCTEPARPPFRAEREASKGKEYEKSQQEWLQVLRDPRFRGCR